MAESTERQSWVQPLHQSSVDMCLRCKRCYMFRYRWCIFPKVPEVKPSATLGHIVHRFMELGQEKVQQVRNEVNESINFYAAKVDAGEDLLGDYAKMANALSDSLDKALAMVTLFWERYPLPERFKVLAVEKPVLTQLDLQDGLPPVILAGRLDRVLVDEETSNLYIRDQKTSGRDTKFTLAGYPFSLQCRVYRILAAIEYDKSPVGFIIDLLRKPSIKYCPKTKDKDGFSSYLDRVKKWYDEQGIEAMVSHSILFTEPLLPWELAKDLRIASYYQTCPAKPEFFGRDETASYCKHYERLCSYYPLCSRDEAGWDFTIEEKFEVVPPAEELQLKISETSAELSLSTPTGDVSASTSVKGAESGSDTNGTQNSNSESDSRD